MSLTVACPSCQSKLSVAPNVPKVRCGKCGQVVTVPARTTVEPPEVAAIAPPSPSRSFTLFALLLPALPIAIALVALSLPLVLTNHVVLLGAAGFAVALSVAGIALLVSGKARHAAGHLLGLLIGAAAVAFSLQSVTVADTKKAAEENFAKAKKMEGDAAPALAEAKKKEADALAALKEAKEKFEQAEDAPRRAAEMLRKAEEAPKLAEEIRKKAIAAEQKAIAAEQKAEEAEKRVAERIHKAEEAEKKVESLVAKVAADRKKLDEIHLAVEAMRKEVHDKKQELADLQEKIKADAKRAEEKAKEAKDLLKKVEDALKGALLNLKSKKAEERLKAAEGLGKLHGLPLLEDTDTRLCEVVATDPVAKVREEALNALGKLRPDLYPHVVALCIPPTKDYRAWEDASLALAALGKKAGPTAPILLVQLRQVLQELVKDPVAGSILIDRHIGALAKIAPDDPAVIQAISQCALVKIDHAGARSGVRSASFIALDSVVKANPKATKQILPCLVAGLRDADPTVRHSAVKALTTIGPEAKDAIPQLRQMRFEENAILRQAVLEALKKIERSD